MSTTTFLMALASIARGQTVLDWADDFDAYNAEPFSGTSGWEAGYSGDAWTAAGTDGVHNLTNAWSSGQWGADSSFSNYLVQTGHTNDDFLLEVDVLSDDDDALGVVFRWTDIDNYYVVFWSHHWYPGTADGDWQDDGPYAKLYSIRNGSATELGSVQDAQYGVGQVHRVRVIAVGDAIDVWLDEDRDGVFEASERTFSVSDGDHAEGSVGLYSYSNGDGTLNSWFDDLEVHVFDVDTDGDGVLDGEDVCPELQDPGQEDLDGDGLGDLCDGDADGDGADLAEGDCDDRDAEVHPGADELCNGIDDDCDLAFDEDPVDGATWYTDADGDGHGDPLDATVACVQPPGSSASYGDCDDDDNAIHPDAPEQCDDVDHDCDGEVDDDVQYVDWFPDADGDGFGDGGGQPVNDCVQPDGYAPMGDCDDDEPDANPAEVERCDGIDNDCDGATDESGSFGETVWYADPDGDGYAVSDAPGVLACDPPPGHTGALGDCDEGNPDVNPGADEVPGNGIDEDCDGLDVLTDDRDRAPEAMAYRADPMAGCGCASGGGAGAWTLAMLAVTLLRHRQRAGRQREVEGADDPAIAEPAALSP
jgi:uncharacterized protein (TIGR03382 family)